MSKRGDKRKKKLKDLKRVNQNLKKYSSLYDVGFERFDKAYKELEEAKSDNKALRAQRKLERIVNENLVPGSNKRITMDTVKDYFLKKEIELPFKYEIQKDNRELKRELIKQFYDLQEEGYFSSELDWKRNFYSSDRIIEFYYETLGGHEFDLMLERAEAKRAYNDEHAAELKPLAPRLVDFERDILGSLFD